MLYHLPIAEAHKPPTPQTLSSSSRTSPSINTFRHSLQITNISQRRSGPALKRFLLLFKKMPNIATTAEPAFTPNMSSPVQKLLNASSSRSVCASRIAQQAARNMTVLVAAPPVKEKVLEKKVNTQLKKEFKQPEMYRLYIYNDPVNKRERVVDVLLKTCQGLTFSRAYAAMQEAHENGRGLVLVIAQEIAEHYCASINSAGVFSTIEPDK